MTIQFLDVFMMNWTHGNVWRDRWVLQYHLVQHKHDVDDNMTIQQTQTGINKQIELYIISDKQRLIQRLTQVSCYKSVTKCCTDLWQSCTFNWKDAAANWSLCDCVQCDDWELWSLCLECTCKDHVEEDISDNERACMEMLNQWMDWYLDWHVVMNHLLLKN